MTDQYSVIGNPIAHSKSPMIHGMFAKACSQDMQYSRLEAALDGFEDAVDAFRQAGGKGMNVTSPFKLNARDYATDLSQAVKLAGAANALKFEGDRVFAENFDGVGLVRDVVHNLQTPLKGQRILLMGAGGAVRGALLPILEEGPKEVVIANRSIQKACDLASIGAPYGRVRSCTYAQLEGLGFDVVFNGTSSSLHGELPPVPASAFAHCALAYDMSYGKGLTPFLMLAQRAGAQRLADGVGMLVEQAAQAFCWWRGVRPDTKDVIKAWTVPLT